MEKDTVIKKRGTPTLYFSAPNDIPLAKAMEIYHFSENVDDAFLMTNREANSTISILKSQGESGEFSIEDVAPTTKDIVLEEEVSPKQYRKDIQKYLKTKGIKTDDVVESSTEIILTTYNTINEEEVSSLIKKEFKYVTKVSVKKEKSQESGYYYFIKIDVTPTTKDIVLEEDYIDKVVISDDSSGGVKENEDIKLKIIKSIVDFDKSNGSATPVSAVRDFTKDGKLLFSIVAEWDDKTSTMPAELRKWYPETTVANFNWHKSAGMGGVDEANFREEFTRAYNELFNEEKEETISAYEDMFEKAQSGDEEEIKEVRDWYNFVHQNVKDEFIKYQLNEFQSDMATGGVNEETGEQLTFEEVKKDFEYLINTDKVHADVIPYVLRNGKDFILKLEDESEYKFTTTKERNQAFETNWKDARDIQQELNGVATKLGKEDDFWEIELKKQEETEEEKTKAYGEQEQWLAGNKAFTEEEYSFLKLILETVKPKDLIGYEEGFDNASLNKKMIESLVEKIKGYTKK